MRDVFVLADVPVTSVFLIYYHGKSFLGWTCVKTSSFEFQNEMADCAAGAPTVGNSPGELARQRLSDDISNAPMMMNPVHAQPDLNFWGSPDVSGAIAAPQQYHQNLGFSAESIGIRAGSFRPVEQCFFFSGSIG